MHADVLADARAGVSLDLIRQLADSGTGPADVHLLTGGALEALDAPPGRQGRTAASERATSETFSPSAPLPRHRTIR